MAMVISGVAAWNLHVPGYMDAEYYYMNGQRLASGKGFTEMVIWNYLDDPQGLPHASHTYWLPFTSLTAALGMFLFKNQQFIYAQIPFIAISACIPLITYKIGSSLYEDHRKAVFAGILALFPGYYLAYQVTTSTLGLYMLEGGLFFWLLLSINRSKLSRTRLLTSFVGLGCIAGMMHLTRSDGILWLFVAASFSIYYGLLQKKAVLHASEKFSWAIQLAGMVFLGYLLIMGGWFLHNGQEFGKIMPTGGTLTLWLQNYNQMFSYPASSLTLSEWLKSGISSILSVRMKSSLDNLMTLLAVEGEIVLLPLFILGLVDQKKFAETKSMLLLWLLTFVMMSWVFPFAGMRGGFLHSSAAFQPFIWALIPAGFEKFLQWGVRKRNWIKGQAFSIFGIGLCVILAVFTMSIYYNKVIGRDPVSPAWQANWNDYVQVEQAVKEEASDMASVIIVNNPPGYYLASGGRPAVVLPDGDEQALKLVAERFQAQFIAIDRNTVDGLNHLYQEPASSDWIEYLFTVGDTRIYRIRENYETP
ncbi:MAG: hypothetical protein LLG42_11120 [Chloroflexi bacterium]|nr:hypothetical protein [Chloroflexota bacterium]